MRKGPSAFAIACLFFTVHALAQPSADIAASCLLAVKNRATTQGGPPVGSEQANADYRECWEGSVRSRDGMPVNLRKLCGEELERRGKRLGTPEGDKAHKQCVDREVARTAPVLAAVTACLDALRPGQAVFGGAEWDVAYKGCMAGSGVDRTSIATEDPKPFGRGKVQAYLNALYHDDLATLRAIDAELSAKIGASVQIPGVKDSMLRPIVANYLIHYPIAYKACLDADSPRVTIGGVYERIRRRGGVEVSREIIDTRRDVPIARHLYALAKRVEPSGGKIQLEERLLEFLSGVEFEELRSSNISHVVAKTMNGLTCSDPVAKQLEAGIVKYAPLLLPN